MKPKIGGILQIGIGAEDMPGTRKWYSEVLHFSSQVLEERSVTDLMTHYTGGKGHERQAAVVMNMAGSGGLEIWQYLSRIPKRPAKKGLLGDLGIYAIKLKTPDIQKAHQTLSTSVRLSRITTDAWSRPGFFFTDPYGNHLQVVEEDSVYFKKPKPTSGAFGAIVGCSDLDRSVKFYEEVLGYEEVDRKQKSGLNDLSQLPATATTISRALLRKNSVATGGFSKFLGTSEIELIQTLDYKGQSLYEGRFWGDPGYIHICFDVRDMDQIKDFCENVGHPFQVDSHETEKGKSFDMGSVTSRVAYIDDPDGTAIEFVETHKVPLIPALGFVIDLEGGKRIKDVPKWVFQLIGLRKVKRSKL